jgi:hypothetical protein
MLQTSISGRREYIDFSCFSDLDAPQNELNEIVKGISHFGFPVMQDDLWQAKTHNLCHYRT